MAIPPDIAPVEDVSALVRRAQAGDQEAFGTLVQAHYERVFRTVLGAIRDLAAAGMTMVIATHEMGFARDVANRVCFLDAGRILEEGSPAEVFGAPREPRTRQFLQRVTEAGRL